MTLALDALGVGIVIPIVPALVRELSGLPIAEASGWVGASVATFALAQFLAAPILGALSDRFGRRPVILISVAGIACNYILLYFAPTLAWLFVGRAIAGGTAASSSAATAYIADITPPDRRAARFGLIGAVFGAAFVFGPAFGGLLGAVDIRLPFLAAAGLSAANFAFAVFILPESLPPSLRRPFEWRRANPVGSLGALTAGQGAWRLALAWSCMWFSIGVLQTVFVLYTAQRLGWGPRDQGFALGLVGLTQVVVQVLLVGRVTLWLGERRAAITALGASVVSYSIFAAASAPWMIYAAITIQSFGSIASPSVRALLSAATPDDRQGELGGGLASVEGLTAIAAPIVAASLFGWFARPDSPPHLPGAPFLAAAALYAVAAIAVAGVARQIRPGRRVGGS